MKDRLYFFRDEVGYEPDEMLARLSVGDIRNRDNEPVEHMLSHTPVSGQDLMEPADELYDTLENKLTTGGYESFIRSLFEHCGEKGDKFNLQFYLGVGLDYETVLENAQENIRDKDPEDLLGKGLSKSLIEYEERGSGVIDLRFVKAKTTAYDLSEIEDVDEDIVSGSTPTGVEVRVYTEDNIVAISNRGMDDEDKNRVRQVIQSWSGGQVRSGTDLMANELLTL